MTLYGGRIPNEDGEVITFPQKQYNDVVMIEGFGAQRVPPKYIPANDNFKGAKRYGEDGGLVGSPLDESGASAGFAVGVDRGQYAEEEARANGWTLRDVPPPGWPKGGYIGLYRREGDWMQTYTGRRYYPVDPRAEEVFIEDIAHSLSLQCRYAGHALQFYSVAEHSVHIARWLQRKHGPLMALHGLLHDATEAYCVDVPRPLKPSLLNYKMIEERNWFAIAQRFSLSRELPAEVHDADNRIIADELVNMRPMAWHARHSEPLGVRIGCWSPEVAEQEFLWTLEALASVTGSVRRAA